MKKYSPENIRTFAIGGHGGSGKTTLVEHILFKTKVIKRLGSVDQGNSVNDYLDEEIARKYSICSSVSYFEWRDKLIFSIDNPGYADFLGEVAGSVAAVDSFLVLVDGSAGIEVGTDNCWKYAGKANLPKAIFINKLDKENSSFDSVLSQIQERYGRSCVPVTLPIGSEASLSGVVDLLKDESTVSDDLKDVYEEGRAALMEIAAETDEELTDKYLMEETLSNEDLSRGLLNGIKSGEIIPVLCGSVEKEIGLDALLDFITDCLPSPVDAGAVEMTDKSGETVEVTPDSGQPLAGQVFKTLIDPYVGNISFIRINAGTLKADGDFYIPGKKTTERVGGLLLLQGKEQESIEEAGPGYIVAIPKLKHTGIGDTVCTKDNPYTAKPIEFPQPMVRLAITPKTRKDEDKIGSALPKLTEQDLTFREDRDKETGEHIIIGMGDVHLNVMLDRLKDKYGVETDTKLPKIAYKEAIKQKISRQGKHKKQSGGRGQYGDVWIELSPLPRGGGFEFVDKIVGGVVPRNYIPAVEKGAVECLAKGVIAGYPVVDVRVTLYDGSYHNVDSSEMAFKIAASQAIQGAVSETKHCLLEPVMDVEITIPDEFLGDVTGNLSSRRGRVVTVIPGIGQQTIKATIPEVEVLTYSADLRSMTGGRGTFTMKFDHYDEVPGNLTEEIVAQAKAEKEAE